MIRKALALAAVLVVACGGGAPSGNQTAGGATETTEGGALSVSIDSPADDSEVSVPFTMKLSSNVELGPTETGLHHVHVWFDDNTQDYLVVEKDSVKVTDLAAGQHKIVVSLRNADHSPAGAETEITVTVTGGGGEEQSTTTYHY